MEYECGEVSGLSALQEEEGFRNLIIKSIYFVLHRGKSIISERAHKGKAVKWMGFVQEGDVDRSWGG